MSKQTYIFLLVGKTGVGKSALGNSILGKNVLKSNDSQDAVTTEILKEYTERDGIHITVVDTPGFMSPELKRDETMVQACKDMKDAMRVCPSNGQLAVIYVIKYGERFTNENKDTLYILENTFGKNNIWKSCMIVMTFGDLFKGKYENTTFHDYLKKQTGDFGELFKKCNYKCVLFSNETKNPEEKSQQFKTLLNCVNNLDQSYTHIKFEEAIKEQNRMELVAKLPNIKEDFQKYIQKLTCNINEIKFNPESSGELEEIEAVVRNKLICANDLDSPEKIYYKDKETRLLEDVRLVFVQILHSIETKKEDFRQMKIAHDFQNEIKVIKESLRKADATNKDILEFMNLIEEKIRHKASTIKKCHLLREIKDSLNNSITSTRQELDNLKMRAQQAEETEITKKRDDIIGRLKNVNSHVKEATEQLNNLKYETNTLKERLEKKPLLINKEMSKSIKSSLKRILHDIKDKEEIVRQFTVADELNQQIENIKQEISTTEPKNEESDRLISHCNQTLEFLNKLVRKENLSKEFTDNINLSLLEAKNQLETLKNQVQERQETEIKKLLKKIKEIVCNTDCQDKEALNILCQAREDSSSLMCQLDDVKSKISDDCFVTTKVKLMEIEKEIKSKQETAQQWLRTDKLMIKINDVTKAIDEINPRDKNISETICKLKAEVYQLQKETDESNVGGIFLYRLNQAVQTAENMIINATISIKKVRKENIESEIEEVKEKISKLNLTGGSFEQETKTIKANLSELISKIKQEELNEDVKAYLMVIVEKMNFNINLKNEDAAQKATATDIMKQIQDVMIPIGEISIDQENVFALFADSKTKVDALKKNIDEAKLSKSMQENLNSSLEIAKEMLSKRKQVTMKTIESDINIILKNITEANLDNADITGAESSINEKLIWLKPRIGDQLKDRYAECENSYKRLVSRVNSFNEINKEIESLISRIKLLGIPCKPNHFVGFRADAKKIKDNLDEKIKVDSYFAKLSGRIDRCNEAIDIKLANNKKKIASNIIRFVPLVGPIIANVITLGVDEEDRNQTVNL